MTVLVIQNFEKTGLGLIGQALAEAGHAAEIVGAHEGQALPSGDSSFKALVVLGGGQNALDDAGSPWLPQVLELMRDFTQAEKPVLGICLGSQLLARAFGGANHIGTASEFGWHEIALTDDGRADPVFSALPARFRSFQWHDDTFTLPPGAVKLAAGDAVANQAYRIGRATYATQFHFEADRALVRQWNADFAGYLAENQPGWAARHPADEAVHGESAGAAGLVIARGWVRLIA